MSCLSLVEVLSKSDINILPSFREAKIFLTRFRQTVCIVHGWIHGKIKESLIISIFKMVDLWKKHRFFRSFNKEMICDGRKSAVLKQNIIFFIFYQCHFAKSSDSVTLLPRSGASRFSTICMAALRAAAQKVRWMDTFNFCYLNQPIALAKVCVLKFKYLKGMIEFNFKLYTDSTMATTIAIVLPKPEMIFPAILSKMHTNLYFRFFIYEHNSRSLSAWLP